MSSVETASTLPRTLETATTLLQSHSCFPDRLVIINEDRILSNDEKKGFCTNLETFLTAGHLVFSRPFTTAKQTCERLKVWLLSCTVTYQRSRPLQQKSYYVSSLKEDNDNNQPTTNYNEQAFKMNICQNMFTSSAMIVEAVDWGRFNTLPA